MKRSLLAGLVEAADQYRSNDMEVFDRAQNTRQGCARCIVSSCKWCNDHLPLTHDVRSIEARYGLNVASFFHFMRYVIFCFFLLGCMNLCTYVWHITDILHSQVRYNATNGTALNNGSRISNWGYTLSKARELKGTCLFDEYLQNTVCTLEYSKYSKRASRNGKHCS